MEIKLFKKWALTLNVGDPVYKDKVERCGTLEELDAVVSGNIEECGWVNLQGFWELIKEELKC
jgi:hypothetical protein